MIDILFVAFNRLPYTIESFEALIRNTNWLHVERLFVQDDGSTDGTIDYLHEAVNRVPARTELRHGPLGGPVAAMNWYLDNRSEIPCDSLEHTPKECWRCGGTGTALIGVREIDNDFVVCPGWLDEMLRVFADNAGLDVLGTEPMIGPSVPGEVERDYEPSTHIGGKGLIRSRIVDGCRPVPHGVNGYQGWTQYQHRHEFSRGWIRPELCTFGIDQIPVEPWASLALDYESRGWARRWPTYSEDMSHYWDWWKSVA